MPNVINRRLEPFLFISTDASLSSNKTYLTVATFHDLTSPITFAQYIRKVIFIVYNEKLITTRELSRRYFAKPSIIIANSDVNICS